MSEQAAEIVRRLTLVLRQAQDEGEGYQGVDLILSLSKDEVNAGSNGLFSNRLEVLRIPFERLDITDGVGDVEALEER